MKVLVIGGAGYIGSHVALSLSQAGHEVCVFDDMSTGSRENLFPFCRFTEGTILDFSSIREALSGVQAVVHLAAKKAVGESMDFPQKYALNNICGTLNVLNAMVEAHVPYFIFSSSAAVYGMPDVPVIGEDTPVNPINFYGFTKLEIERFLSWYDKLKGIKFVSLRYFNAVGYDALGRVRGLERNPQNLLPIVMETAAGLRPGMFIYGKDYPTPDGTCIRDYIHVSDLADAHVKALAYLERNASSQILNLGTGKGHSVLELVQRAAEIMGRAVPYEFAPRRPGDPAVLTASSACAEKQLGWRPLSSDLDTIIQTTWQLYSNK